MPRPGEVRIKLMVGDAMEIEADVLLLKYAQHPYGLDRAVANALTSMDSDVEGLTPSIGEFSLVSGSGAVAASSILMAGVADLYSFRYREIQEFARESLRHLTNTTPAARVVMTTIHGPGYGLDEAESLRSLLAGFLEAIEQGLTPPDLERIVIAERDTRRLARLRFVLDELLPSGYARLSEPTTSHPERLPADAEESDSKAHVFVAMPFAAEYDDLYHYGIQGATQSAGYLCERADLKVFTGDVMSFVQERIATSDLVIAVLTSANPNVYLEIGFAWGCGVNTVLLCHEDETPEFDVQGHRHLRYDSIKDLEDQLSGELRAIPPAPKIVRATRSALDRLVSARRDASQ